MGSILSRLATIKNRALFLVVGVIASQILVGGFDYVLYPFVIWRFGLLKGGAVMALLSLVACSSVLVFYNLTKKDWFGIELAKELREYKGRKIVFRIVSWVLKRGQLASFFILSLKFDPFTTVAYMRPGANEFPEMDSKSWKIFFASWLVGNLSWLAVIFTGISALKAFHGFLY